MSLGSPLVGALPGAVVSPLGSSLPWDAPERGLPPPLTYIISGFSDANNFSRAANTGPGLVGWVSILLRVTTKPVGAESFTLAANIQTAGWYVIYNRNGFWGQVSDSAGGFKGFPVYVLPTAGELHQIDLTCGQGVGGKLRTYDQGAEAATAVALTGSPVTSDNLAGLIVGAYQGTPGFASTGIDIVAIRISPTEPTPAQVATDAAHTTSRTSRIHLAQLPGETFRWEARTLIAQTDWHDLDGDDATLTKNGAPTVALLA